MKISFKLKDLGQAPEIWLRGVGYTFLPSRSGGEDSFARRLGRDFYPRFHIYFSVSEDHNQEKIVIFKIHLDQKKPGYAGQKRHNAEYQGELVEREVERLKSLVVLSHN